MMPKESIHRTVRLLSKLLDQMLNLQNLQVRQSMVLSLVVVAEHHLFTTSAMVKDAVLMARYKLKLKSYLV